MQENNNPWTIKGEKHIYENAWISLTEYDVLNPSGGKGIYGKVHFKNTAVGIVPIDADGYTTLVGQYRFTLNAYSWEIPEGGSAPGDDPLDGAKRELKEETGLVAKNWQEVLRMHLSNSVTDEMAIIYLATDLEQASAEPEETEQLVLKRVHFSEAVQMVDRGEITDSMSVAAILKVEKLLQQE